MLFLIKAEVTKHAPVFLFIPPACPVTQLSFFFTAIAKLMWPPLVKILSTVYCFKCHALVGEKERTIQKQ